MQHHLATRSTASRTVKPDVLIGRVFNNRFRIQSLLARGGMGRVYRAVQEPLGRAVALKVLSPRYIQGQSQDFHERFYLEAATAARLTHPHTVTIFDYGCSDDGIYYMAMELLDGISLRDALLRRRIFEPARAVVIALQICRAVRQAHGLGVVHRDLKPANIFLLQHGDQKDFAKVLDFGLVKEMTGASRNLTQTGLFMGSPGYMAPEQIRGQGVDKRCDIYAMGTLLYEMLMGRPPFVRTNALEVMMAQVHDPVPRFSSLRAGVQLPAGLERVVLTCLAKDPNRRYGHMDALMQALQSVVPLSGEAQLFHAHTHAHAPMLSRTWASALGKSLPPLARLDDEESGWSVVTSTGILARPRTGLTGSHNISTHISTQRGQRGQRGQRESTDLKRPSQPGIRPPSQSYLRCWRRSWLHVGATAVLASALVVGGSWRGVSGLGEPWIQRVWERVHALWTPPHPAHPPLPATVHLRLRSHPQGAAVFVGSQLVCARTPCQVDWQEPTGGVARSLSLRFVRDGFDELIASRIVKGAELEVCGTLHPSNPRMWDASLSHSTQDAPSTASL